MYFQSCKITRFSRNILVLIYRIWYNPIALALVNIIYLFDLDFNYCSHTRAVLGKHIYVVEY